MFCILIALVAVPAEAEDEEDDFFDEDEEEESLELLPQPATARADAARRMGSARVICRHYASLAF
jgi:hypothetical protein